MRRDNLIEIHCIHRLTQTIHVYAFKKHILFAINNSDSVLKGNRFVFNKFYLTLTLYRIFIIDYSSY